MQRCDHINVMTIRLHDIFKFVSQDVLINHLGIFSFIFGVFCFHVCPVYCPL